MMAGSHALWSRVQQKSRRLRASMFCRRPHEFRLQGPLISFSFDDFPENAGTAGAAILEEAGARATYYVSLGLMGRTAPTGEIFREEDLGRLRASGHELGCHTHDHCHAWETGAARFAASVEKNLAALREILPGASLPTLSYPVSCPRPAIKRAIGARFAGCRGGGHRINLGTIDRNNLSAYFLERAGGEVAPVREIIEQNARSGGWLIFATHDISGEPTRYGCTPGFFEQVVKCAVRSGAEILPVSVALGRVLAAGRGGTQG